MIFFSKTVKRISTIFLCLTIIISSSNIFARTSSMNKLYTGFNSPVGMGFDSIGNLYVAEWGAGIVSRIGKDGSRSIFAKGLKGPSGLAVDSNDNIYVASYSGNFIYKFNHSGKRSIFVKGLATPAGLSFDRNGNLLIANRRTNEILSVSPDGKVNSIIRGLQTPVGAVQTPDGGYFISNINGGVSFKPADGKVTTINSELYSPGPGITINSAGEVFVVDYGGTTVNRILPDGKRKIIADGFQSPAGLSVDKNGFLYVATWGDGCIYIVKSN